MSDLSHVGNAGKATITSGGQPEPPGKEKATVKNADLANIKGAYLDV